MRAGVEAQDVDDAARARVAAAKPLAAAVFLTCNGLILLAGEQLRQRASARRSLAAPPEPAPSHTTTVGAVEHSAGEQAAAQQLARIPVGAGPHGLCVYPQPGRYSLGHTGVFR